MPLGLLLGGGRVPFGGGLWVVVGGPATRVDPHWVGGWVTKTPLIGRGGGREGACMHLLVVATEGEGLTGWMPEPY